MYNNFLYIYNGFSTNKNRRTNDQNRRIGKDVKYFDNYSYLFL